MTLSMVNDEWVRAAMTDDAVVVELLVRLKKQSHHVAKSAATLRWGIRQPRSRSTRCDVVSLRKDGTDSATNSMRASPTTPLSWSGGGSAAAASPSATADDETSRHQTSAVRSKGVATNETTSNSNKRSRKKKTFAELKEEEGLLLKERIHLNKELETLRATYKTESARNDNLKRIKLDLGLDSGEKLSETQVHDVSASSTCPIQQSESYEAHEAVPACNSLCMLPDLNMMPAEDDSASETLYVLFDGHNGPAAAIYTKENLLKNVECLQMDGVLQRRNLVYCASTSVGKSFVAEILMLWRVISTGKMLKHLSKEEFVMSLRRQNNRFARGSSKYRGIILHKCGIWEARME